MPTPLLTGHRWTLTRVISKGRRLAARRPGGNQHAWIAFDGKGRFTADDTCNQDGGSVRITRSTLAFLSYAGTLGLCLGDATPGTADAEHAVTDSLKVKTPQRWAITATGELRITVTSDRTLVFVNQTDPWAYSSGRQVTQGAATGVRYRLAASASPGPSNPGIDLSLEFITDPMGPTWNAGTRGADDGRSMSSLREVVGKQVLVGGLGPAAATRFTFHMAGQPTTELARHEIPGAKHEQAFFAVLPLHPGAYQVVATDKAGRQLATTGLTHN